MLFWRSSWEHLLLLHRRPALWVEVALSNFGATEASLGLLPGVRVSCLKLAPCLVQAISSVQGERLCRALVAVAKSFGMRVIAPGVESDEQALRLIETGCLVHQGPLYGPPSPPAQAVVHEPLREHRRIEFSETLPAEMSA